MNMAVGQGVEGTMGVGNFPLSLTQPREPILPNVDIIFLFDGTD